MEEDKSLTSGLGFFFFLGLYQKDLAPHEWRRGVGLRYTTCLCAPPWGRDIWSVLTQVYSLTVFGNLFIALALDHRHLSGAVYLGQKPC